MKITLFFHVPGCSGMFQNVSCSWFYRRAVTSVLCKLTFSKESRLSRYKHILTSANAKYRYSYLFFCKMNKGDLPLMYSCIHRFSRFFWLLLFDSGTHRRNPSYGIGSFCEYRSTDYVIQ